MSSKSTRRRDSKEQPSTVTLTHSEHKGMYERGWRVGPGGEYVMYSAAKEGRDIVVARQGSAAWIMDLREVRRQD